MKTEGCYKACRINKDKKSKTKYKNKIIGDKNYDISNNNIQ